MKGVSADTLYESVKNNLIQVYGEINKGKADAYAIALHGAVQTYHQRFDYPLAAAATTTSIT